MQKINRKRRTISSAFNIVVFIFLVATLSILLWQLPNRAPSAAQIQTQGQIDNAPTGVVIETETVPVEEIPLESSILMTETYVLYLAPELGIVTDEKLNIILIEPGSAAEKAGLQLGDILERIEGIPLVLAEDRSKAKQVYRHNLEGMEMQLTVIRNGETLELPFVPMRPSNLPENMPTITPVWPPYDFF